MPSELVIRFSRRLRELAAKLAANPTPSMAKAIASELHELGSL